MISNNFKNIYIMTTMDCNIHCDHCFVPKIKNQLSNEDLKRVCDFINIHNNGDFINITFHGGEPTMVGSSRLKEILDYMIANINEGVRYKFDIQTNLVVLNNDLLEIYEKYFDSIGVSYDVKIRHLKNGNFDEVFFKNLEILNSRNIEYLTIVTLTNEVLKMKPIKFYEFLKKNFRNVHLEKLTHDGEAIKNWESIGVNNLEYSKYMIELFKIYSIDNLSNDYFNISPLDMIAKAIIKKTNYSCKGMCSNFYSFGPDSFIGSCTALLKNYDSDIKPKELVSQNMKFTKETIDKSKNHCEGCEFLYLCKSGCPSGKNTVLDESNECRGAKMLLSFIDEKINNSSTIKEHFMNKKISIEFF